MKGGMDPGADRGKTSKLRDAGDRFHKVGQMQRWCSDTDTSAWARFDRERTGLGWWRRERGGHEVVRSAAIESYDVAQSIGSLVRPLAGCKS